MLLKCSPPLSIPRRLATLSVSRGKIIQSIQEQCECTINIEDDGHVFISGLDVEKAQQAVSIVETIAKGPEIGAIYNGKVTRLMTFGAFVEIVPGVEGLVHISRLDVKRVEKVEDCVTVGDQVMVKVEEIDDQGRLNLSRRAALVEIKGLTVDEDANEDTRSERPRRGFKNRR